MRSTSLRTSISHRIMPEAKALAVSQVPARGLLANVALWLMVWGTYNVEVRILLEPDFLTNPVVFFHGLRSLLPFLAAYLAIIILLARRCLPVKPFQGPLDLVALYALAGFVSSVITSDDTLRALYWVVLYSSVLLVLWVVLSESNPLTHLSHLITINWAFFAILAIGFFAFFLVQPGAASTITSGDFLGRARPFDGLAGIHEKEILGLPGTRPTGLARYAGVAALVTLARLWQRTRWPRSIWLCSFLFFSAVLIFSQARAAIAGFLGGALLVLWLQSKSKPLLVIGIIIVLSLLGLTVFYHTAWVYLTRGTAVFDTTFSGRTITWQRTWQRFLTSPLLGCGFHADRILDSGTVGDQHIHNAFLHALLQTGLIGVIPFVLAFVKAWTILFRLLKQRSIPRSERSVLIEIAGVLTFLTIRGFTESIGALYGTDWLILAPLFAYITILNRRKSTQNHITFK